MFIHDGHHIVVAVEDNTREMRLRSRPRRDENGFARHGGDDSGLEPDASALRVEPLDAARVRARAGALRGDGAEPEQSFEEVDADARRGVVLLRGPPTHQQRGECL